MNTIKLPHHISGCGDYGKAHLAGQVYQDSLKCDKLARVEREIKTTLSQEHGVVGTASFHRTQAYEHVLQIIINSTTEDGAIE